MSGTYCALKELVLCKGSSITNETSLHLVFTTAFCRVAGLSLARSSRHHHPYLLMVGIVSKTPFNARTVKFMSPFDASTVTPITSK